LLEEAMIALARPARRRHFSQDASALRLPPQLLDDHHMPSCSMITICPAAGMWSASPAIGRRKASRCAP